MSEREIVRRNGYPIMFCTPSIQYVETGKKDEPQQYRPNSKCKKLKKCEHKHHHHHHKHHHHHEPIPPVPPVVIKWKCSGRPDYQCTSDNGDGTGIYNTQLDCITVCRAPQ
jgi:ABC-type nickel/cobalt efflux system permease component RcnA